MGIVAVPRHQPAIDGRPKPESSGHPSLAAPQARAACEQELSDQLLRHPSLFGRLIYISALCDTEHEGYTYAFTTDVGDALINQVLGSLHYDVFTAWLSLTLRQTLADLSIAIAANPKRICLLQNLEDSAKPLIPKQALGAERQLFLQDLAVVKALLC